MIRYKNQVGPRVAMVLRLWQPAPEGATWDQIDAAWLTLHAMLSEAARLDSESRNTPRKS